MWDIVIPTYRRPEKVISFVRSYLAARTDKMDLYLCFDNNDTESAEKVQTYFGEHATDYFKSEVLPIQHRAFRVWNRHLKFMVDRQGMFYICDDVTLFGDCLEVAIDSLEKRFPDGDGIIGLNQENIFRIRGMSGFCAGGMGLLGERFIQRFPERAVFCPDYVSFKADNELLQYSYSVGKFFFAETARLVHNHPRFNVARDMDDTHLIVRDKNVDIDRQIYGQRRQKHYLWGRNFDLINPDRKVETMLKEEPEL